MIMKKIALLLFTFVVGLTFLLTGCGEDDNVGKVAETTFPPGVFVQNPNLKVIDANTSKYKFDPPVTVTVIRFYGPQVKFQAGENIDNNVWTRAYESECGIKLKSLFSVNDFSQYDLKVTTSIATDSLPDIIPVWSTLFFRIVDSGRAMDLKPYYDKYLRQNLKDLMEKDAGGLAYKTCFRKGILAAIAPSTGQSAGMQWIRQDWLEKLKLQPPKSINDTLNIANKFCEKNLGASFGASACYAFPITAKFDDIKGYANAFGAYKSMWIDDGNGGLMRSDISEKWKPALQILADLFAAEKLNPDFSLQNGTDIDAAMSREQYGIYFGDATAPDGTLYNSVQRDNNAVWQQYPIYDTSGNPALVQVETRIQGFNCVNKNSKNPEALMLIANIYQDLMQGVGISYRKYHDFVGSDNNNYDSFFYPFMGMLYPRVNNAEVIAKAKKTGDKSKLTGEQLGVIDKMNKWVNNKDVYGWRLWAIDKPGGSYETNNFIRKNMWVYPDRGWGPETATWISKGPDLYNISNQYFTKIVRGDLALEQGFTEWVNYFNSNGGLDCTNEINDWWKNGGGKDAFDNIKVQIN